MDIYNGAAPISVDREKPFPLIEDEKLRDLSSQLAQQAISAALVRCGQSGSTLAGAGSSARGHESRVEVESPSCRGEEEGWPNLSDFILKNKRLLSYGDIQTFPKAAEEVIGSFVSKLIEGKEPFNLYSLFQQLGEHRGRIAVESRSSASSLFGILRKGGNELYSLIWSYSDKYDSRIKETLNRILENPSLSNDHSLEFRGSSELHSVESSETDRLGFLIPKFIHEFSHNTESSVSKECVILAFRTFYAACSFAEESPFYHPLKQFVRLLKIGEKTYPIGTYLMSPKGVYITHLNSQFIEELIEKSNPIFMSAINWDKKNRSELIEIVAQLQYITANICPYMRGSAAVCEWIERIIYQYHGLEVRYNPDKCVNLEALTSSLEEFLRVYPSCIRLYSFQFKSTQSGLN
jgi:hypothetical protein